MPWIFIKNLTTLFLNPFWAILVRHRPRGQALNQDGQLFDPASLSIDIDKFKLATPTSWSSK